MYLGHKKKVSFKLISKRTGPISARMLYFQQTDNFL